MSLTTTHVPREAPTVQFSSREPRSRNPICNFLPFTIPAPALPHNLPTEQKRARQAELNANQELYEYASPHTIPGIAFIKGPVEAIPEEMPSRSWWMKAGYAGFRVIFNFIDFHPLTLLSAFVLFLQTLIVDTRKKASLDWIIKRFQAQLPSSRVAEHVQQRFHDANVKGSLFEEKSKVLEPYRKMWRFMSRPQIADNFLEDAVFAWMRVAGFNPMSLFGVREVAQMPFEIADAVLPQHQQGDSVIRAVQENRMYALDFSEFALIQQEANSKKVLAVTKGLFVIPPGRGGALQPVAIEVNGELVLPNQERGCTRWAAAKLALTNNDIVHHELIAHLGRTHLLVEPFVAATMRQLPSAHPLHMLLRPHFEGTVFINDLASNNLVAKDGEVDRIFAGDITSVMKWCADKVLKAKFNELMPDVEMETRGLMDPKLEMPYREDALEHFDALQDWVRDYLSCFYADDNEVRSDAELQAWVAELVDPERGRLKDFGDDGRGRIETLDYLVRAVAFVIFSASVQHAAVNFPQFTFMSYAPAAPGSLWRAPPRLDETADLKHWADMLTPTEIAVEQVQILGVIGDVYHTRLGWYGLNKLPWKADVWMGLRRYWRRLARIENRIALRERGGGPLKYEFMRPSRIPQSINI